MCVFSSHVHFNWFKLHGFRFFRPILHFIHMWNIVHTLWSKLYLRLRLIITFLNKLCLSHFIFHFSHPFLSPISVIWTNHSLSLVHTTFFYSSFHVIHRKYFSQIICIHSFSHHFKRSLPFSLYQSNYDFCVFKT